MKHIVRIALLLSLLLLLAAPVVLTAGWFATGPSADARASRLLVAQERAWADPERTVRALHLANPEFDLMWRLFTVLAASDRALAHPEEAARWLALSDAIIADTARIADVLGQRYFLLPYADHGAWQQPDAGSLFVDGELALMIAARRTVADSPALADLARTWNERVVRDFELAGDGLPESYPDEAWAFCITNALLALRLSDAVDGSDHSALIDEYTARMTTTLVDPATGLLGSDWRSDGTALDGTEGSSIWWVSTGLRLLDPDLAAAQYSGARDTLVGGLPGLAWSREWPGDAHASDIDSGPIIPFFDASPAASGFALVAATAHGDAPTRRRLVRALRAADLLLVLDPRLATMAEAPMGDAIIVMGLGFGPLFDEARRAPPP